MGQKSNQMNHDNNQTVPAASRAKKVPRTLQERLDIARVALKNLTADIYTEYGAGDAAGQCQAAYIDLSRVQLPK